MMTKAIRLQIERHELMKAYGNENAARVAVIDRELKRLVRRRAERRIR